MNSLERRSIVLLELRIRPAEHKIVSADALLFATASAFEDGVPAARVTRIRGRHCIFLSNEADVMCEMRAFLAGLNQGVAHPAMLRWRSLAARCDGCGPNARLTPAWPQ